MKAERRHELKENDLIHLVGEWKDYVVQHSNQILLGVAVVAIVLIAITWATRSRARALADSYLALGELKFSDTEEGKSSMQKLDNLVTSCSAKSFKLAALTKKGDVALRLATLGDNPPDAELNGHAESAFNQLLNEFPKNEMASGIAHLGLATVSENKFAIDGNITHRDDARRHLEAVKGYAGLNGMPMMQAAIDRLNLLDETCTVVTFAPAPEPETEPEATAAPEAADPAPATTEPKENPEPAIAPE